MALTLDFLLGRVERAFTSEGLLPQDQIKNLEDQLAQSPDDTDLQNQLSDAQVELHLVEARARARTTLFYGTSRKPII